MKEKKWYIGNTATERDCYFLFQATEEEFTFLRTVIESFNGVSSWLLCEPWSGVLSVFDIPFDTKEEAEEFFRGNRH